MVYNPLTITAPHEPQSFAYPEIDENLNLVWDHLDGNILGPIHASGASVHQYDEARGQYRKIAEISDVRIDCFLTESRLAMICHKYDKGGGWVGGSAAVLLNAGSKILAANRRRGKALTGHLRFPWLQQIMFAPNRGCSATNNFDWPSYLRAVACTWSWCWTSPPTAGPSPSK